MRGTVLGTGNREQKQTKQKNQSLPRWSVAFNGERQKIKISKIYRMSDIKCYGKTNAGI